MGTPINSFLRASATRIACLNHFRRIAASRARSVFFYLSDMPRRSLIELLAIRLSPQAGKSLVMRGSLRFIPQNKFLEVPQ